MEYEHENEKFANQKGNYAIYIDEKLRFFKITTWCKYEQPKRIYLKEIIGGGEEKETTISVLNPEFRQKVLMDISNDENAGLRYSEEMVRCYKCGRQLTDEISRQTGLGPSCRQFLNKSANVQYGLVNGKW